MNFLNSKNSLLLIVLLLVCTKVYSKQVQVTSDEKNLTFIVDLASSYEEKKKGLMFVNKLKNTNGMLFTYDSPQFVNIWMKNTPLDLDIIFINQNNVISSVKNGKKFSETIITSEKPVIAVLEIPTSCNKKIKLKTGFEIKWTEKKISYIENKDHKNKKSLFPCAD